MIKYVLKLLIRVFLRLFYCFPVVNNRIIFFSYGGKQYSCNPKYIYEYLYQKHGNKFQYVWVFNKNVLVKDNFDCIVVRKNSIKYFIYIMTSKIIIDNGYVPFYIPIRKNQKIISTFHGGGAYKKSFDDYSRGSWNDRQFMFISRQAALSISSSKKFSEIIKNSIKMSPEKILECGMPRNDIFFSDYTTIKNNIRNRYNILSGQTILLYAPTFRDNVSDYSGTFFMNQLKFVDFIDAMEKKFNIDVVLFYRLHQKIKNIDLAVSSNIVNVTDYPDMQELLCATDFLITDYSSSMWDFSLTGKPGFLFVPDLDEYEAIRAFYTPIETWPYPFARTNDELIEIIKNYNVKYEHERIDKHLNALGSFECGNASESVDNAIMKMVAE
jgi:CDP-glycerol glycerophosphotransferase